MNTAVIKSAPRGKFEEISIEMPAWRQQFQTLIRQRKHIKFLSFNMPTLSRQIQGALAKQNYVHMILGSDDWQHFLVPR